MARPFKNRKVCCCREGTFFKPRGVPLRCCEIVNVQTDEMEALYQADILGKTQEQGAEAMGISRSTFGRILESAHRKTAEALYHQKAIKIIEGPIIMKTRVFQCKICGHQWEEPFGTGRPDKCPQCNSDNFGRTDSGPRNVGCNRNRHGQGTASSDCLTAETDVKLKTETETKESQ